MWQNLHKNVIYYNFATQQTKLHKIYNTMNSNVIIGRNLKLLREANRYTQEKLSEYLGINRSTYSNYESGERGAPIEILEKACDILGCELTVLFEQNDEAVKNMLVCAFRADSITTEDMKEVADFKKIVLCYMKMENILLNHAK